MKALDKRIAARLLSAGEMTEAVLEKTLREFDGKGSYHEYLLEHGFVSSKAVARALAEVNGFDFIDLSKTTCSNEAITRLTAVDAWRMEVLPISVRDNELTVAMGDPTNVYVQDDVRIRTGLQVRVVIADKAELYGRMNHYYGASPSGERKAPSLPQQSPAPLARRLEDLETTIEGINTSAHEDSALQHREFQRRMRELRETSELIGTSNISQVDTRLENPDITTDRSEGTSPDGRSPMEAHAVAALDRILDQAVLLSARAILLIPGHRHVSVRVRIHGPWQSADSYPAPLHEELQKEIRRRTAPENTDVTPPPTRRVTLRHGETQIDCTITTHSTRNGARVTITVHSPAPKIESLAGYLRLSPEHAELLQRVLAGNHPGAIILSAAKPDDLWDVYTALCRPVDLDGTRSFLSLETSRTRTLASGNAVPCRNERDLSSELEKVAQVPVELLGVFRIDKIDHLGRALSMAADGQNAVLSIAAADAAAAQSVLLETGLAPETLRGAIALHLHVRRVPALCQKCCQPIEDRATLPNWASAMEASFYEATGCEECQGTGYAGVVTLTEVATPAGETRAGFETLSTMQDAVQALALAGEIDPREAR